MTIASIAHGFISVPVAIVGTAGTVLALSFDPTIAAAAAVTVIVALTAGIVAILTKLGDNKRATQAAAAAAAHEAAATTLELAKIARSVDGVATRQTDKVTTLEARIADLLAQLAEEKSIRSTLAATDAAVALAKAAGPSSVTAASAPDVLKKIDKNTADTASNTKK